LACVLQKSENKGDNWAIMKAYHLLFFVTLTLGSPVYGQTLTEDFSKPANAGHGSQLGQCGQLTAGVAASGSITINGGGSAIINTASVPDAAMIFSSDPLPATYTVTVRVKNVNYHKTNVENGVTLLAITNQKPIPGTEVDWMPKRVVGVELDSLPDFVNDSSAFVNYWNAQAEMYTWNGSSWGKGDAFWKPYWPVHSAYEITIEKTASQYTLIVRGGGAELTRASVAVGNVMPGSAEYLVVGDRLTDFFAGNMEIDSITMPGSCNTSPDAGPPNPDTGPQEFPKPEAGTGGGPDGAFKYDSGQTGLRPKEPSSCDCNVAAESSLGPLAVAPLLLLLLFLRRRR
jgi:MYXO-CTERM domain-containing protein